MGDEIELRSMYVVLPDGSAIGLPAELASFEFVPEVSEPSLPYASAPFELTATLDIDWRAFKMLLGLPRVDGRELLMHHRRRSPHGWRFRDR